MVFSECAIRCRKVMMSVLLRRREIEFKGWYFVGYRIFARRNLYTNFATDGSESGPARASETRNVLDVQVPWHTLTHHARPAEDNSFPRPPGPPLPPLLPPV